ncbi:MAG: preprotein translocase subunit YajC [Algoriphagus sp. 32-45-6]|jgi:preprotein translocase subunit YajC|nr:MAG: preprotein translocase subunit YajC [Algoriphagus sp. 32-45-6]
MMLTILAQASAGGAGILGQVFLFGSIILIMYFFMIRPQQKKQKDTKKFIEEIKKGDDVVTIGGIHGKVSSVEGDVVMLDIDRGVKIKIEKSAISLDFSKKTGTTK